MGVITGQGVGEYSEYLLPFLTAHNELMAKVTWMHETVEGSPQGAGKNA
ncbi:MAG: hypothetical protein AAF702_04290 [Chloroflexota bacterium]